VGMGQRNPADGKHPIEAVFQSGLPIKKVTTCRISSTIHSNQGIPHLLVVFALGREDHRDTRAICLDV